VSVFWGKIEMKLHSLVNGFWLLHFFHSLISALNAGTAYGQMNPSPSFVNLNRLNILGLVMKADFFLPALLLCSVCSKR